MFEQGLAFALTLAVELPLVGLAAWRCNISLSRAGIAGLVASGLSHPIAWTYALGLDPEATTMGFIIVETAVVAFEAAVLALIGRFRWSQAAGASLVANIASAVVGLFLLG